MRYGSDPVAPCGPGLVDEVFGHLGDGSMIVSLSRVMRGRYFLVQGYRGFVLTMVIGNRFIVLGIDDDSIFEEREESCCKWRSKQMMNGE